MFISKRSFTTQDINVKKSVLKTGFKPSFTTKRLFFGRADLTQGAAHRILCFFDSFKYIPDF